MKLKKIICLILLTFLLLRCNANEDSKIQVQQTIVNKTAKDSVKETLKITLERGAFHYDTFSVIDTILTFTPGQKLTSKALLKVGKEVIYYQKFDVVITKEQKKELIDLINNEGFWDYQKEYKAESSCTSGISISISLGDKNKKITSDDYKRDCPKGLYLLEHKLIELTGKDLKRIYLPG